MPGRIMYREEVSFDRLPNEAGGDPTKPLRKVIVLYGLTDKGEPIRNTCFMGSAVVASQHDDGSIHPMQVNFPIVGVKTLDAAFAIFDESLKSFCDKMNDAQREAKMRRGQNNIVIANEVPSIDDIRRAAGGVK